MAKSTGTILGTTVLVSNDGETIACTTNATLTITNEEIETTCKDNNGAKTFVAGSQDWTVEVQGNTKYDASFGFSELAALAMSGSTVELIIGSIGNADNPYFQGDAFVSSFTYEGPLNAPSTFSVTYRPRGPLYLFNT